MKKKKQVHVFTDRFKTVVESYDTKDQVKRKYKIVEFSDISNKSKIAELF